MSETPLMMSVSGLRGIFGRNLRGPVAARYATAVAHWLAGNKSSKDESLHVVIGRDSRPSGSEIEVAVVSSLVASGCDVTRLGIATTPGVAAMIEHLGADGGLVITASHNPAEWNGIKTLRHDGIAPSADQAHFIIEQFKSDRMSQLKMAQSSGVKDNGTAAHVHVEKVLAAVEGAIISKRRFRVVVDSVHGAGGPEVAELVQHLDIELIHLYGDPTGTFPHGAEPTCKNLTGLCQAVKQHKADVGFAQDPDGDRLAIVDENGVYIGEEYTLVLACLCVLQRKVQGEIGLAAGQWKLAANLSTSRMIDDLAASFGAEVVRTAVGESNVANAMRSCGAVIGGEGNGGVIWPPISYVRDSLVGIVLVLELLASRQQPLSQIIDQMPRYAIVKDKVEIQKDVIASMAKLLGQHFGHQTIDTQDGVRIDWPDRWVHVRASNTEPILRIIAESRDETTASQLIDQVRELLGFRPVCSAS